MSSSIGGCGKRIGGDVSGGVDILIEVEPTEYLVLFLIVAFYILDV